MSDWHSNYRDFQAACSRGEVEAVRESRVLPESIDRDAGTVETVFSTGATVRSTRNSGSTV